MGEVLTFQPRVKATRDIAAEVPLPARPSNMREAWCDPDNWQVSRKGDPFIQIRAKGREYCVTLWRTKDSWWAWCIALNGEPIWSPAEWDVEHEARDAAWKALEELEGMQT